MDVEQENDVQLTTLQQKIHSNKIFILGFVLFIVVFASLVVYLYLRFRSTRTTSKTPIPSPIVTQPSLQPVEKRTYKNSEYGYQIVYPSDWTEHRIYSVPNAYTIVSPDYYIEPGGTGKPLTGAVIDIFVDDTEQVRPLGTLPNTKTVSIDTKTAIQYEEEGEFNTAFLTTQFTHGLSTYRIRIEIPRDAKEKDNYLVVYNEVLESLTFLEPESSVSLPPRPPRPTNLLASTVYDALTIQLRWDPVAGATSYAIKRSETDGGPYIKVGESKENSHFDSVNIKDGVTYYYVVTAITPSGESPNSNQASDRGVAMPHP